MLCYPNWQAGRICFSESFESLSLGIQDALWKLGGAPSCHRTDNLTSAVHKVGHPDIFTDKYRGLAGHYGFESSKTNPASPHENGDVEKSNDLFKKTVNQSLIIRGSRDFDSVEEYEKFLQKIIDGMNQNCHKRFAEELEVLKELPNLRYDDYETRTCKVSRGGTIRLLHNTYSVHSRLVGETVKELHLPMFREYHRQFAQAAIADELGCEEYLYELAQRECEVRRANKIARLVKASKLPLEKTLQTFEIKRLPLKIRRQVKVLTDGSFADHRENILAFGKPGSGKTHLLCGICHELARQGRKVYFATCDLIVQELLRAKQDMVPFSAFLTSS